MCKCGVKISMLFRPSTIFFNFFSRKLSTSISKSRTHIVTIAVTMLLLLLLLCAPLAGGAVVDPNPFERFVATFNGTFNTPTEHAFRQKIFASNQQKMELHRKSNPHAQFSVVATRWSDWTETEFTQSHGYADSPGLPCQFPGPGKPIPQLKPTKTPAPDGIDYVALGATTPVKNQGKVRLLCVCVCVCVCVFLCPFRSAFAL